MDRVTRWGFALLAFFTFCHPLPVAALGDLGDCGLGEQCGGGGTASSTTYDNADSTLAAGNVKTGLDELDAEKVDAISLTQVLIAGQSGVADTPNPNNSDNDSLWGEAGDSPVACPNDSGGSGTDNGDCLFLGNTNVWWGWNEAAGEWDRISPQQDVIKQWRFDVVDPMTNTDAADLFEGQSIVIDDAGGTGVVGESNGNGTFFFSGRGRIKAIRARALSAFSGTDGCKINICIPGVCSFGSIATLNIPDADETVPIGNIYEDTTLGSNDFGQHVSGPGSRHAIQVLDGDFCNAGSGCACADKFLFEVEFEKTG